MVRRKRLKTKIKIRNKIEKQETHESIEMKIWRHKAIFERTNRIEETARNSVANNRNWLDPTRTRSIFGFRVGPGPGSFGFGSDPRVPGPGPESFGSGSDPNLDVGIST